MEQEEWENLDDISRRLTDTFRICECQRMVKTIIDNFYSIYEQLMLLSEENIQPNFTGTEWLIIAMMDTNTNAVCHGSNCQHPIINENDPFWLWIVKTKNNPNLKNY